MTMTRRNEDGVTAVVFGLSAVLLFSLGAIAVDLGNTFARKRDVQAQADFAALAGGAQLPAAGATPSPTDAAVAAVAQYLYDNQPQNDNNLPRRSVAQLKADITDADLTTNGQVYYGSFDATGRLVPSTSQLTVVTPPAWVKFGLAAVMGFNNAKVRASATVGMGTPGGSATMPFFAVDGACGWGPQALSDPAFGHADAGDPPPPLDLTAPAQMYAGDPTVESVSSGTNANQIYSTDTGDLLINGPNGMGQQNYTKVDAVGFFRDNTQTGYLTTNSRVIATTAVPNNSKLISIPVSTLFSAAFPPLEDGVWYVRLRLAATQTWTTPAPSQALKVGTAYLRCPGVSSDGNFGSLRLVRTDTTSTNDDLAKNIAAGLQPPITLKVYPPANVSANGQCSPGDPSIISDLPNPGLFPDTNCVDTDTGLTANGATLGLLSGSWTYNGVTTVGRLLKATSPGCSSSPNGQSNQVLGYTVNNDILSCFMTTNDPLSVITKDEAVYTGPLGVLSSGIYSSPRFAWVPVLKFIPTTGGSGFYSIVDFRAAFITGEMNDSRKNAVVMDSSANGLKVANNGITSMGVIFFHWEALPPLADGSTPIGPWLGVGPKVVQLIN